MCCVLCEEVAHLDTILFLYVCVPVVILPYL